MRPHVFATLVLALLAIVGCSESVGTPTNFELRAGDAFVSDNRNEVYVAARSGNLVLRYDASTFSQIGEPLDGVASPEGVGLAVDGVADTAYVSNDATGTISVFAIDGAKATQLATIGGVASASGVAVDERACKLFVTGSGGVHVFDTSTPSFQPIATLSGAEKIVDPGGLAVDSGHGKLFVAQGTGTVEVFDTHHLDRAPLTIPGLNNPGGVAVDTRSQRLYVTENYVGDVKSFALGPNGYTFESVIASGLFEPFGDAYDPQTGRLFVVQFGYNDVLAFDTVTHRKLDAFYGGLGPWAVAILDHDFSTRGLQTTNASAISHRCSPTT